PKGKDLAYVLDGFLFESCNVVIDHQYEQLDKVFLQEFKNGNMSMEKYGRIQAEIENGAVMKQPMLDNYLQKAVKPLEEQPKRNLKAISASVKKYYADNGGNPTPSDEAMLEDVFGDLDGKHQPVKLAILKAMSESQHNRNAKEPT